GSRVWWPAHSSRCGNSGRSAADARRATAPGPARAGGHGRPRFVPEGGIVMPLKLNVGASRKVTDHNYGSRGASVNLELELDAALASEPQKLRDRIRKLFGLARAALAEALNGGGTGDGHAAPAGEGTPESKPRGAAP